MKVFEKKYDKKILEVGKGKGMNLKMMMELRKEINVVEIDKREIENVKL